MIRYNYPAGVEVQEVDGRPVMTTSQGGKIVVDAPVLQLWQRAHEQTLSEILEASSSTDYSESMIQCALACLAEAGLLERHPAQPATPSESELIHTSGPMVSTVIVGYNSRQWLDDCIPSLLAQTHQPVEIILIDNGSKDDTLSWVHTHYPDVRTHRIESAISLSAAINMGVRMAHGEYFLILNPDVCLKSDAISQMVQTFEMDPQIGAVAAKLKFLWAPAFLNGLGNRVGPFSWGTDNALGHLDLGQFDHWQELPSACFAATLVPRAVWEVVGPVDEGFPMYYEDAEWSYRSRLLGYKVWAAPQAVVYHAFGARVPDGQDVGLSPFKLRNVVYGRYRFAFKIPGERFYRFLRNYWLEDWANLTLLILQHNWASARAYLSAWCKTVFEWPSLCKVRRDLQSRRVISDEQLFAPQSNMPMPFAWHGLPELTWEHITHHYLPLIREKRTHLMPEFNPQNRSPHLLIVSHDVVDKMMAGPGMRYLEMARVLKDEIDVTLAVPAQTSLDITGLNIVVYQEAQPGTLQVLVENSDIALVSGYMVEKFPFLESTRTRLVVDVYDPMVLENLHYYFDESLDAQDMLNRHAVNLMNRLVRLGDFFICGNERQRDFWLGVLAANERINPLTYAQDSSLRTLIDIVGIGFPAREPQCEKPMLRGAHPLIPEDAHIVLWGGGIWNWLDPLSLVRAWPQVIEQHPKARLVFMGTQHPNPDVPVHDMVCKTIALAEEIGEKDRTIIFLEWVSYVEREALLVESNVGVVLHPVHVETRYSARTRVLDYLWARLPVLITEGDVTSEWVQEYGLGRVAPEADPDGVAAALNEILARPKETFAPAFEPLMERLSWPEVIKPLLHYCHTGGYAPDRQERLSHGNTPSNYLLGDHDLFVKAMFIWRTQGAKVVLHRVWRYVQWRLSR